MRYARVHEGEKKAWRTSSKKRQRKTERQRVRARENRRDEKGRRAKIGRRLWLWTTDHQQGLAHGPDHRRDLVGRTDLARCTR